MAGMSAEEEIPGQARNEGRGRAKRITGYIYPKIKEMITRRTIRMARAKRASFSHLSNLRRNAIELRLLRLNCDA